MASTKWTVIGRDADGICAVALSDGRIIAETHAETDTAALVQLGHEATTILRIGEGTPDATPCKVISARAYSLPVVTQAHPPDVLGAWVRLWITGFLARHENWDGVLCVQDGDVTHWVHVSADEIVSFASFLTLRLIAALGGSETPDPGAMADSQSRPERLAQHLRAAEVGGCPDAITGHLIGAELSAARVYWLGQQVALIAPAGEASAHALALVAQGVPVACHCPDDLMQDGFAALGRASGIVA